MPWSRSRPWIISASIWLGAKATLTSLPPTAAATAAVVRDRRAAAVATAGDRLSAFLK